jgi:hypothetical protein
MGWRIDYTKSLDPTVPKKSRWPFRTPFGGRFTIPSLIAIVVVALAIEVLFPELIIELLRLPDKAARVWLDALYCALLLVLVTCVGAVPMKR